MYFVMTIEIVGQAGQGREWSMANAKTRREKKKIRFLNARRR